MYNNNNNNNTDDNNNDNNNSNDIFIYANICKNILYTYMYLQLYLICVQI